MVAGLEAAIHPEYNLLLLPADAEKFSFSDVSNSSWMYKYVMKIATLGFAEGDTAGNFNPKAPLTALRTRSSR
ncbi:S-layer homology domain-containing protein [Paenibacillus sp. FSL H8-0332]|uniref:S-layer homology domain-containing protein n=1 Tax=Paenibacillus sp. FSL H8-0332 TaxID=2954742 RepID=UPI0030D22A97